MSVKNTLFIVEFLAQDIPIQPLPLHKSIIVLSSYLSIYSIAFSTKISLSARGISTSFVTIYCSL